MWRDAGDWERLRGLWHPDGRMIATWTEGTGDEFVAMSKAAWAEGPSAQHRLGGISIDLKDDRAVSQTKMTISQRSEVGGAPCDVTCTGRFYNLLERRNGRWSIVLRQMIHKKDRVDPVLPGTIPTLDTALLKQFPPGYCHLAHLQTRMGFAVKGNMAGLRGPEVGSALPAGRGLAGQLRHQRVRASA